MMNEQFGEKVRVLRHRRNLTQQEVSYRTGISTPHISSLERGQRHPSLEYAERLAEALGVPINYLCEETEVSQVYVDTAYFGSSDLPLYLQNFVMSESAQPYLIMAHRVSRLDQEDYKILSSLIEILVQRHRFVQLT
jgi:transcriptional regulator with XRE-family HTH domain